MDERAMTLAFGSLNEWARASPRHVCQKPNSAYSDREAFETG